MMTVDISHLAHEDRVVSLSLCLSFLQNNDR